MAIIEHNYNLKLLRLNAEGKVPREGIWHADIRHDDWCAVFQGQYCDCDPDIRFVRDAEWMNVFAKKTKN
jgi:hypothetical protein